MVIIDRGEYFHQEDSDDVHIRTLIEDDVSDSYVRGLNDIAVNLYLVGAKKKKQTIEDIRSFVRLKIPNQGEGFKLAGIDSTLA